MTLLDLVNQVVKVRDTICTANCSGEANSNFYYLVDSERIRSTELTTSRTGNLLCPPLVGSLSRKLWWTSSEPVGTKS